MNTTSTNTTESQAPAAWWQAFDESEATVVNQYVWGARPGHRDELILRDRVTTPATRETSSEPPEPDERLWSLMDYYDPTSAVNTEGEVVERYRFSAFGLRSILAPDFSPRAVSHYDWDFAFKGQFLDVDTGYYNYGYRYYSPELGRWLSRDPIGVKGGLNLYVMAGNDAVNGIDKLGLLVNATYEIKRQRFTAVSDSGDRFTCRKNGCSCGDNNENNTGEPNVGPLPKGVYKIYKRVKNGDSDFNGLGTAWILDAQDANPGDDTTANGRFGFRIHLWVEALPQKGSDGCIVLSEDCHSRFEQMLERTTPGPLKRITSPNSSGGVEQFDEVAELGTLTVK